jgi:undecaprenyl-diphosphatase
MILTDVGVAVLLGVVEGVTEFLPISSTGHLIILVDLLGFNGPPGRIFEVVIQFGAILGVCLVYRQKLMQTLFNPLATGSRHFLMLLSLGFIPSAAIGFFAHDFIKSVLFNPIFVSLALLLGGIVIIVIEKTVHAETIHNLDKLSRSKAAAVGFCQAIAMIPGTSRSAATIMGGRVLGLSRGVAAEFSFLLAIPTMLAASTFDLYKNSSGLDIEAIVILTAGFVAALITAVISVRWLMAFVSSHSFEVFGWYRIALGSIMLLFLGR